MSLQRLNFGTGSNNDGEVLRTAFPKLDENDAYLDGLISAHETRIDVLETDVTAGVPSGTSGYALIGNGVGNATTFQGFTQAGTGAVERTWLSKMRDVVSVKDFGAVGDGVTDDATATQAAIDALELAGGGTLYFPGGDYLLGAGLVTDSGSINFIGDGELATTLALADGVDEDVITFSQVNGGYFGGIGINGNRANQSSVGDGIVLDRSNNVVIERFYIQDCYRYGIAVTGAAAQRRHKILNGLIEDTGAHGVYINDDDTYTKEAIRLSGVFVQRPGRNGALSNQACYYISGWSLLSDCFAREFEDQGATRGFWFVEGDDPTSVGANNTTATNCHARGVTYAATSVGFLVDARHVKLFGCFGSELGTSYFIRQQDGSYIGCHSHRGRYGFVTEDSSGFDTNGDKITFINCVAALQSSGVTDGEGFVIGGDDSQLIGCTVRDKNNGVNIESTAANTRVIALEANNITTNVVLDNGTGSKIHFAPDYSVAERFKVDTDNANVQVAIFEGDRATPADGDTAYMSLRLSDDAGTQTEFARIAWAATDVNVGTSVDGRLQFSVMGGGSLGEELYLTRNELSPWTNDGLALGNGAQSYADLFLASGGVMNFANGNFTITHSTGLLTFSGEIAAPVATIANTGLHLLDTDASHDLIVSPGSNLTADRTLTITTGDANRTLTIGADSSISGTAYVVGGTDVALADGGTGASNGRAACANIGSWHVLRASAVAASHTGDTSETTLATINVPAGAMGANGVLRIVSTWSITNSANNKTQRVRIGGIGGTAFLQTVLTTAASAQWETIISNRASVSSQFGFARGAGSSFSSTSSGQITAALNTSSAFDLVITAENAKSGETSTLERYIVEIYYAA